MTRTRKSWRGLCAIGVSMLALSLAMPAAAEEDPALEADAEAEAGGIDMNSRNCGFSFFTEEDDRIDFRGSKTGSCFDMMGGSDLLVIDRNAYPKGVKVYSGPGRDTVLTSDGPDVVVDSFGEDAEIRTYAGDDRIEINPLIDEDPFRGVETTARTELRPGSGSNTILIGKDVYSNAFARISPNAWLWTEAGAADRVEMDCGRPQDLETFDFRSMEVPENAQLSVEAMGCGLGFFGQMGSLDVQQVGGRFALRTKGEKFRRKVSDDLPRITGAVQAGRGAFLDLTASDPKSDFTWQGREAAIISADIAEAGSGGSFTIASEHEVLFAGVPGPSALSWTLVSDDYVEVDLTGSHDESFESFALAAPEVEISWRYAGGASFPAISTALPIEVEVSRVEPRSIEFYEGTLVEKAQAMIERAMGIAEEATVGAGLTTDEIPEDVPPLEVVSEPKSFLPGAVRLTLKMREERDPSGACFAVRLIDRDGFLPDLEEACASPDDRHQVLAVEGETSDYEIIEFLGPQGFRIEMNGQSNLQVDSLRIFL